MRKVDKLGRIVIPLELRRKYGLTEGAKIEFIDDGRGVTVRASASFCRICLRSVSHQCALPLCEECIAKVVSEAEGKIVKT